MKKIFNSITVGKFKGLKITFLCIIVAILIAEVVLEILNQNFGNISGKFALTFGLIAVALAMSINGLIRIEKGDGAVRSFAIMSLLLNVVWLISAILLILGVWEGILEHVTVDAEPYDMVSSFPPYFGALLVISIITVIVGILSAISLLISNILAIIKSKKKR